ncbi:alpha-amylase family glycosyl hydrolase [Petrocella sp. FN5]|uniref:alpha-amylase family glycosyl hydrolase n=1 Tax=Petrocella sp. FN5 TaxID=3032002 RepID=UPI0023DB89C4|nr:alpha-amylase family glycosyl hydrolase [Petrocella sp. FN5]MDF1617569.1 alpha-amylase family glycosyl hydrolase [Petrocella sp. FN5]
MGYSNKKGSTPIEKGYRFTVWAPNADAVFVVGDFNKWEKTENQMRENENGWWSIDIPEAKLGDEYRYRIVNENNEYLRIDPYAHQVTNSVGNAIIVKSERTEKEIMFMPPKLNEMIIYELHIGTFGKQGTEPGQGDLEGAIKRLAYLKELGINAVEIMPLAEFAGGYSWGYNPSHIFAVESNYGVPQNFREFVNEAHKLGIAVIVDVVYNHFGPSDLDLWQFDGWHENEKGGIYFYNDWRSTTPWGETRPDYGRNEVREYICDNALMWFQEYDVDGLRWDMTAFIRNVYGHNKDSQSDLPEGWSLMQWINEEIRKYNPHSFTIAEDLQNNAYLTKSQNDGGAGFSSQWAAPFVHAIRTALIGADDAHRDMDAIRNAILHRYHLNAFERVIYTESHDEVANGKARIPEEVDPGNASSWAAKKKSTLGAVLIFTTPGIPMIFQGQEFLEDDWFHDQDPIDWTKKEQFTGILQLYKDLIKLRLNCGGQTKGLTGQEVDVYHINQDDKIIAWHRWDLGGPLDSVVVVANFSSHVYENYLIDLPAVGKWIVRLNSDGKNYDKDFGGIGHHIIQSKANEKDDFLSQANIDIAPYSAIILSQEKQ